jgi:hypothetical protein
MSSVSVVIENSDFTVDSADGWNLYLIDASANNITVSMSQIITDGQYWQFKRIDSNSSNSVTFQAYSGDSFAQALSLDIGQGAELVSYYENQAWYNIRTQ